MSSNSGYRYGRLQKRVRSLQLDTSHFRGQAWGSQPVEAMPLPFTRKPSRASFQRAATSLATAWFLERGYGVSVPAEPRPYDLVVESDEGFAKIQVKSTVSMVGGCWTVGINRLAYDASARIGANGARRKSRYLPNEVDFFFIVVYSGDKYIIPYAATSGVLHLTLDRKYAAYRVN